MYLRTVFELEEEGIVPLRARIAERLSQSGPTVSQTVARMERDGLMRVEGDRQLSLTPTGRALATRVMRKHRLAECLLVSVIGLPWEDVHVEACRCSGCRTRRASAPRLPARSPRSRCRRPPRRQPPSRLLSWSAGLASRSRAIRS